MPVEGVGLGWGRWGSSAGSVCVVPGAAAFEGKIPCPSHVVAVTPLYPAVAIDRVYRTPVPRRFQSAQKLLKIKNLVVFGRYYDY